MMLPTKVIRVTPQLDAYISKLHPDGQELIILALIRAENIIKESVYRSQQYLIDEKTKRSATQLVIEMAALIGRKLLTVSATHRKLNHTNTGTNMAKLTAWLWYLITCIMCGFTAGAGDYSASALWAICAVITTFTIHNLDKK